MKTERQKKLKEIIGDLSEAYGKLTDLLMDLEADACNDSSEKLSDEVWEFTDATDSLENLQYDLKELI
tara:strand:- start:306 stop:509 length:204 start_codon:yes stop_codon:yes gene_type:complete